MQAHYFLLWASSYSNPSHSRLAQLFSSAGVDASNLNKGHIDAHDWFVLFMMLCHKIRLGNAFKTILPSIWWLTHVWLWHQFTWLNDCMVVEMHLLCICCMLCPMTLYTLVGYLYILLLVEKKGFHFSSLTEYISLWLLRTIIFEQGAYLSDRQNWEFWMIVKYKIKSLYLTFHTLSWWVQAVIMMAKLYSPTKFHGNRTQFELPAPVFDCESRPQVF